MRSRDDYINSENEKLIYGLSTSPHPKSKKIMEGYRRFLELSEITLADDILEDITGEINVGYLDELSKIAPEGTIIGFHKDKITRHAMVCGATGSGKTNFLLVLFDSLLQFVRNGLNPQLGVWLIDPKGGLSRMAEHYSEDGVIVLRAEQLRLNPLTPPPTVDKGVWAKQFFPDILSHSFILGGVSRGALAGAVEKSYDYVDGENPSFYELYLAAESMRPKGYGGLKYMNRTLTRVGNAIIYNSEMFCRQGYDLAKLVRDVVVFDISELDETIQRFAIDYLLTYSYVYHKYNSEQNRLNQVIICDEAAVIFSNQEKMAGTILTPIEKVIKKSRQFGIAITIANQQFGPLSEAIKSNCYYYVMLPMSYDKDIHRMAGTMNIHDKSMVDELDVGHAIIRKTGGVCQEPFLTHIPKHEIIDQSSIRDERLNMLMKPLLEPHRRHVVDVDEERRQTVIDKIMRRKKKRKKKQAEKSKEKSKDKETEEKRTMEDIMEEAKENDKRKMLIYLQDIIRQPFCKISDHNENLKSDFGNSAAELKKTKDLLKENGYIDEFKIKIEKRRGPASSYLGLTKAGKSFLKENKMYREGKAYYEGKGGFCHALLQYAIRKYFEQKSQQEAVIECKNKRGYNADVGIYDDEGNRDTAVEISVNTTWDDEVKNLKRDIKSGWEKIILIPVILVKQKDVYRINTNQTQTKIEKFEQSIKNEFEKAVLEKIGIKEFKNFRI